MSNFKNVTVVDHPLVQHKLALLRDKNTSTRKFRELMHEVSLLLGYELLRDMPMEEVDVETPLEKTKAKKLAGKKLCLISILRAGNGLLEGLLDLAPAARVGHIGLYRDPETLIPVEYFLKFPDDLEKRQVIIMNPVLATGGSAIAAIGRAKDYDALDVRFLCLVASPEGIKQVHEQFPDVKIFTAAIDREINAQGNLLPGIGDAGDRIFGTK
ncbi:MAG: uracil phosphoribosyltransferase [Alphaproteobacteria bacterium]|nr:uracil phosphoribosyltransferase [Alphaproteobacteria bacterium]